VLAASAVALDNPAKKTRLSLYKRLFYFKDLLWESIIMLLPLPHLQGLPYCNTIARPLLSIRPPTDPPVVCHTPYTIGDDNVVLRPKHGQV